MAQHITSENFNALCNTGKPMILDFWATWCGPCRRMAPVIDELIEEDEDLPMRFGVRSIPTILFIKDGQVVDKQIGACPKSTLQQKLEAML